MLSAKVEDMDKIIGLTTGADDYMEKPFNPLELSQELRHSLDVLRCKALMQINFQMINYSSILS